MFLVKGSKRSEVRKSETVQSSAIRKGGIDIPIVEIACNLHRSIAGAGFAHLIAKPLPGVPPDFMPSLDKFSGNRHSGSHMPR